MIKINLERLAVSQLISCLPHRYNRYRRHPKHFLVKHIGRCIKIYIAEIEEEQAKERSINEIIKKIENQEVEWLIPDYVMDVKSRDHYKKKSSKKKKDKFKKKVTKRTAKAGLPNKKNLVTTTNFSYYCEVTKAGVKLQAKAYRYKPNSNKSKYVEIVISNLAYIQENKISHENIEDTENIWNIILRTKPNGINFHPQKLISLESAQKQVKEYFDKEILP